MKFQKVLGWLILVLTGGVTIGLIIFAIVGTDHPMMFLRGLIVLPTGIWWGLKTLHQDNEEPTKIERG